MDHDPASVPAVPADSAAREGERRQADRRVEGRRNVERISVRALIAVLVAVAAAVVAVIALWRNHVLNVQLDSIRGEEARLAAASEKLQRELAAIETRTSSTEQRIGELGGLSARFADLNASVEELRGRADRGQRAWMLAEAEYLLEIANRRLALERDVGSALAALLTADQRLRAIGDPGLSAVRRRLASEIQAVRVLPQPDLTGIAARLAAAEELSSNLTVLGAIPSRYVPPNPDAGSAGVARGWRILKSSLANIISVRRIGQDAVELVSLEEQGVRRHHLQLLLFAARVAALRGDESGFHASVSNARHWLKQMFDEADPRVVALSQQLASLEKLEIAPALPDISGSLQLLKRRQHGAPGAGPAS
jgi:uroporphyrin-3 C-methyltransferase